MSFTDMLSGGKLPSMMSLKDLSAGFKAVRLTVAGSNGDSSVTLIPLLMFSMASRDNKAGDLMSMVGTY